MNKIVLAAVCSLLAGLAVGAWFTGDGSRSTDSMAPGASGVGPANADAEQRLARLEQMINEERDARIALEDTLAMLFEEIERLEGPADRGSAQQPSEADRRREARASNSRPSWGSTDWLSRYQERRIDRMVEGGFSEDEARRIMERESEAQFLAMQAAWEAERSGEGLGTLTALNSTQSILRAEIGDDAYTRYLEVQGQPTSVNITQVLNGSPATSAGLQPGDQLVRYGGERVFSMSDLRRQTLQGKPGEDVVIEIDRNGTRMQLTVPRGPIGITGNGANIRGARWWGG